MRKNEDNPRKYIKEVKNLFPIIRKQEKKYIASLYLDVSECYIDNHMESLGEIYNTYGAPIDIVHNYFSTISAHDILKSINLKKTIRKILYSVFLLVFAFSILLSVVILVEHHSFMRQEAIFIEDSILDETGYIQ